MSIEVRWYFCQSISDLYKRCSLNTHMYIELEPSLNIEFLIGFDSLVRSATTEMRMYARNQRIKQKAILRHRI